MGDSWGHDPNGSLCRFCTAWSYPKNILGESTCFLADCLNFPMDLNFKVFQFLREVHAHPLLEKTRNKKISTIGQGSDAPRWVVFLSSWHCASISSRGSKDDPAVWRVPPTCWYHWICWSTCLLLFIIFKNGWTTCFLITIDIYSSCRGISICDKIHANYTTLLKSAQICTLFTI